MSILDATQVAANLATVIALVSVAWQLRLLLGQNRVRTGSALIRWERDLWSLALQNPDVAPEIVKAVWGDSQSAFAVLLIDEFEHAFIRSRDSSYDRALWLAHEAYIVRCLRVPEINRVWRETDVIRPPDFLDHFNGLLSPPA